MRVAALLLCVLAAGACGDRQPPPPGTASARNLLLITVDTMRADRLGAYGDTTARTPVMDGLAARGTRFDRAYAVAPITLPSHASMLTGRYPAGHGARHNGIRIDAAAPTLTETLANNGFATAAFVAAFPLDRRFGLIRGFQTYGDQMPRAPDGRAANERAGAAVVDEAIAWLEQHRGGRFFLWVHLFEPHAPYGEARSGRPAAQRYGGEITEADRQIGRLLPALGDAAPSTMVMLTSDHGEAFGEHGEIGHSIFVYDTTLRVPWIVVGPGVRPGVVDAPVSLVDLAPTAMAALGMRSFDADGVPLTEVLTGAAAPERTLYAESFAPLLDFGWSPLRAVRAGGWKYIAAPEPELYHVAEDPAEGLNMVNEAAQRAAALGGQVARFSGDELDVGTEMDREAAARLQALGYTSGARADTARPDPKSRREQAARIARVTSGEVHGPALERLLREILADEPRNPLANLRLGLLLVDGQRCAEAAPRLRAAIARQYPSADPHLGLAACQAMQRDLGGATETLRAADRFEPGNPVVLANLGLMLSDGGSPAQAVDPLRRALAIDPQLHQARFGLAVALARAGRRADAAAEAEELLRRLPANAPQRPEVERLVAAVK